MAVLSILSALDAIESIVPAWRTLVDETPSATVYQTPEWTLGWWRALAHDSTPFCVTLFEGARLVGIAPLSLDTVLGARALRFMGTPHDDPNRALVAPSYERIFADAFACGLQEQRGEWDVLRLGELREEHTPLTCACARLTSAWGIHALSANRTSAFALPDDWHAYWQGLARQRRKVLTKAMRQLEQRGTVGFQVFTTPAEVTQQLPIFFAARLKNWKERKRLNKMVLFQQTAIYRDTLQEICIRLAARENVWLARLDLESHPIGWDLVLRVNHTISDYMTTFDAGYAAYSPGHLVFQRLLEYAIAQRIQCVDMGPGAQPYKAWFRAALQTNANSVLYWKRPRSFGFLAQQVARDKALNLIHHVRHSKLLDPSRAQARGKKPV